jgi:peptidyl-prolyl cis-trans isomerase B (cyclophilin B)
VPSNEQRRQAAKRKLERQLERRAERARRRRTTAVVATVVAVLVVAGGVSLAVTLGGGGSSSAAPASQTGKGCDYRSTPGNPAPPGRAPGLPPNPKNTPSTGTVNVTLKTNFGDIPLALNRAEAPCTVQSMLHLVNAKFFDKTPCHRQTSDKKPPLYVLQCGDPTGKGNGGPGYTIPDERPKNLKPAPTTAPLAAGREASVIYPAGTLAMANSGQPHTAGSQFFLVYKDSELAPDYTVFGHISPAGLKVVDDIASKGISPGADPHSGAPTPNDGQPKQDVTIKQAVVVNA